MHSAQARRRRCLWLGVAGIVVGTVAALSGLVGTLYFWLVFFVSASSCGMSTDGCDTHGQVEVHRALTGFRQSLLLIAFGLLITSVAAVVCMRNRKASHAESGSSSGSRGSSSN